MIEPSRNFGPQGREPPALLPDSMEEPFLLNWTPARAGTDLTEKVSLGVPPAQSAGRFDALQFYGIRELELRRDAGVLWGLNPIISLGLDFMLLSEESKESQDATTWWNLGRRLPDGLLGGAGMGPGTE